MRNSIPWVIAVIAITAIQALSKIEPSTPPDHETKITPVVEVGPPPGVAAQQAAELQALRDTVTRLEAELLAARPQSIPSAECQCKVCECEQCQCKLPPPEKSPESPKAAAQPVAARSAPVTYYYYRQPDCSSGYCRPARRGLFRW